MPTDDASPEPLELYLPVRATGSSPRFVPPEFALVRLSPQFARWAIAMGACVHALQARSVCFADQHPVWIPRPDSPGGAGASIETEVQVSQHGLIWWGRRTDDPLRFHTGFVTFNQLASRAARLDPQVVADGLYLHTTTTERAREYLGALLRSLTVAMVGQVPPASDGDQTAPVSSIP